LSTTDLYLQETTMMNKGCKIAKEESGNFQLDKHKNNTQ